MKRSHLPVSLCFILLALSACNKNSDQLPPVKTKPTTFTKKCFIDDREIDLIFVQKKTASTDTVAVYFHNRTSDSFANLNAVAEICNVLPQNYDNCHSQYINGPALLKGFDTGGYRVLATGQNLTMDSMHINAGIVSYTGATNSVAGKYRNNGAYFIKDTATAYPAVVKGYILEDGTATFRIKWDTTHFTITGIVVPPANTVINALTLYKSGSIAQYLQQTSFTIGTTTYTGLHNANDSLDFMLRGNNIPVSDSLSSIFIHLLKN